MHRKFLMVGLLSGLMILAVVQLSVAQQRPVLDMMLTNYEYPFAVHYLDVNSQGQQLKMAYMDVQPVHSNGKIITLLHGKNFNGAYWKTTIEALTKEGYRVIVPDQIGFGKSSKPVNYQYSFQQLALNTKAILDVLKVQQTYLLGHSMGGMLATRFTLMFPETVTKLILENPIGLEDWKQVAPYSSVDQNYQTELKATYASAKAYQLASYYDHKWKSQYDEWVYLLTGWVKSPDYPIIAMVNAKTTDMCFTQPVVDEFKDIKTPTLLIIGTRDRTAIGRDRVKDRAVRDQMGQYQLLGKATQAKIQGAELVELDNVGHMPHIETFERFIRPLETFLAK